MAVEPQRRQSTPLHDAATIRSGISHALHEDEWYNKTVSPRVAACLIGIAPDILENTHMAILFHHTPDGYTITAGTTRQVALESFRQWNDAPDDRSKASFARDAYMSLYRMFQAAHQGVGDVVFAELAEYFVTALAERDDTWMPFLERVKGFGDIPGDADAQIIGEKMADLWSQIPRGMQSSLASYSPERMFK